VRFGPRREDAAGIEAAYHDEERRQNGSIRADGDLLYLRGYHRLYWTARTATAAEVFFNLYAGDPLGIDSSFARLSVQHAASRAVDLQLGVEYGRNAEYFDQWNGFGRLSWRF